MQPINNRTTTFKVTALVLVSIFFTGCSGGDGIEKLPLYSAGGTVKLDGEPFGPVSLRFEPEEEGGRGFVGQVDESGNINVVTTYEIGDGAPVGTYKVTVFSSAGTGKPFPAAYESAKSTPLKVIIADITGEGANAMDIQLDSKAGRVSTNSTTGHLTAEQFSPGVSN